MLMNTDQILQVVVENCKAKNLSDQSSPGCRVGTLVCRGGDCKWKQVMYSHENSACAQ